MSVYTMCSYCPRLCRHVCPVAVATGREAATVTSMMSAALLVERGAMDATFGVAGTSLCLGCGACTAHCALHIPVPELLRPFRDRVLPEPLALIDGPARTVCVLTRGDWSATWSRREGVAVAILRTGDALGHAAWKQGSVDILPAVAAHLSGRDVVTASGAAAEVLTAAGIPVRRLATPPSERVFHTCHDGPRSGPDQLACCGRREGFAEREPDAAREVAEENVRLLAGAKIACVDEECAAWLREHGGDVIGPGDTEEP